MIPGDTIVKTLLFPFLMGEGAYARFRAGTLPEPPGARQGETGTGAPLSLLLTGDSSAAGVGAAHQDEALIGRLVGELAGAYRLRWRLEARTGNTTRSLIRQLEAAPGGDFDVAVVALGVNDVTSGVRLSRLIERRSRLHALLRQRFGAKRLVVSGIAPIGHFPVLPQPLRWVMGRQAARFDVALMQHARGEGVDYIPFTIPYRPELMASDGFHPAPEAYRLWAHMLARHVRPPEPAPAPPAPAPAMRGADGKSGQRLQTPRTSPG